MKQITVLKALTKMDEKRVETFLANDYRGLDEIVDSVSDESERTYVEFMHDLFKLCDGLRQEEGFILASQKNPIVSEENRKLLMEHLKERPSIFSMINNVKIP